jgi:hypothetical protein
VVSGVSGQWSVKRSVLLDHESRSYRSSSIVFGTQASKPQWVKPGDMPRHGTTEAVPFPQNPFDGTNFNHWPLTATNY